MKCPFCFHHITPNTSKLLSESDAAGWWEIYQHACTNPVCKRNFYILRQIRAVVIKDGTLINEEVDKSSIIFPRIIARDPANPAVPKPFSQDYDEACLILEDSPQASAALGRRCLQALLRDVAKAKPGDLVDEIREIIERRELPGHLAENIDAIRIIGNFAAHPTKSKTSGAIVPVEAGEAEWTLEMLDGLFDFYFVQPEATRKKKAALNKKLAEAGKPPLA